MRRNAPQRNDTSHDATASDFQLTPARMVTSFSQLGPVQEIFLTLEEWEEDNAAFKEHRKKLSQKLSLKARSEPEIGTVPSPLPSVDFGPRLTARPPPEVGRIVRVSISKPESEMTRLKARPLRLADYFDK